MAFQATTGLGTPAKIAATGNSTAPNLSNVVSLSLTNAAYPSTFQLNPQVQDVSGAPQSVGTAFTLTSVVAATPAPYTLTSVAAPTSTGGVTTAVYTGTITSGGSNAFAGRQFVITGFAASSGINNGTFQCTASSTTTLALTNVNAVVETHAGAAQDQTATAAYTGTITGGGSNAFKGQSFTVAGFVTNTVNNGTFYCSGSSTTVLTLDNPAALAETHAATATAEETSLMTFVSYNQTQVTVSATGLLTAVAEGGGVVEISYPTFNNGVGSVVSSGNIMNGLPINKIYREMNIHVRA